MELLVVFQGVIVHLQMRELDIVFQHHWSGDRRSRLEVWEDQLLEVLALLQPSNHFEEHIVLRCLQINLTLTILNP